MEYRTCSGHVFYVKKVKQVRKNVCKINVKILFLNFNDTKSIFIRLDIFNNKYTTYLNIRGWRWGSYHRGGNLPEPGEEPGSLDPDGEGKNPQNRGPGLGSGKGVPDPPDIR